MMRFRPKNIPSSHGFYSKTFPQGLSRYVRPIQCYNNIPGRMILSSPFLVNRRTFTNSSSIFNQNKDDESNATPSLHSNQSKNNPDSHPFNEVTPNNLSNKQQRLDDNNNNHNHNSNNNPIQNKINNNNSSSSNNNTNKESIPLTNTTSRPDRIIDLPASSLPPNDPTATANSLKQQRNILRQANQNISATLHYAGQSIEELENMLMKRLNENNKRRFRMYFFGSFSLLFVLLYVFGGDIRKMVSAQTADLAKETLENESLQIQTQQLAMAVVQTILNDPDVTALAASFLKEASTAQETQLALLELVTHVLQHPQSLQELARLSEQLLQQLTQQPQVQQQLVALLNRVLMDEQFQIVLVQLLQTLFQHPEIVLAMTQCFAQVFQQPEVQVATQQLVTSAAQELLADEQVMEESRRFIADVMGDDSLQKEGGDALWNSLNYALKPGFIKITGVMLIGLSIGAFRLFISPF